MQGPLGLEFHNSCQQLTKYCNSPFVEVPNPLIFYDIVLKDFVNNVTLSEFGPSCFVKAQIVHVLATFLYTIKKYYLLPRVSKLQTGASQKCLLTHSI